MVAPVAHARPGDEAARPCRWCGKPIRFWRNQETGKILCLDTRPAAVVTEDGAVFTGYISHWATCPQSALAAAERDRKRAEAKPAPAPASKASPVAQLALAPVVALDTRALEAVATRLAQSTHWGWDQSVQRAVREAVLHPEHEVVIRLHVVDHRAPSRSDELQRRRRSVEALDQIRELAASVGTERVPVFEEQSAEKGHVTAGAHPAEMGLRSVTFRLSPAIIDYWIVRLT